MRVVLWIQWHASAAYPRPSGLSVLNPSIFSIPQAQGSWFDVVYDYSHDYIMHSFEDSLQRLGLARIDILYVHDIGAYQHGAAAPQHVQTLRESGYRALESVKRSGTVGAIGIGVNERAARGDGMGRLGRVPAGRPGGRRRAPASSPRPRPWHRRRSSSG